MSISKFQEMFGISSKDKSEYTKRYLTKLGTESPFRFEYITLNYSINHQTFYISKSAAEKFLSEDILVTELFKRKEILKNAWLSRMRENGIKPIFLSREKRFITKSEFELLTKEFDNYNTQEYYSDKEFYEILGRPVNIVRYAIEEEYDIHPLKIKSRLYYKKGSCRRFKTTIR
ncbi:hypothetical protein ACOI1C_21895, partial [Bacillus sp. DJP31]|uniref:hypothetical protein n=1 Tax=Bacillus sp. DJP31 TaxID=3409789 RepID=UPI003BB59041